MSRILAVFAHPDDESLLCGATLASHVGEVVKLAVMTDGVASRYDMFDKVEREKAAERRAFHFHKACEALGIPFEARCMARLFEDQRSDQVPQIYINQAVEELVRKYEPDRIYTHFIGDLNIDHRRVCEAVQVATRGICEVWMAESEWPSRFVGREFCPNRREVPFADMLARKLAACACYVDELRDPPHPRSLQEIRKRTEKGEAFEVIR